MYVFGLNPVCNHIILPIISITKNCWYVQYWFYISPSKQKFTQSMTNGRLILWKNRVFCRTECLVSSKMRGINCWQRQLSGPEKMQMIYDVLDIFETMEIYLRLLVWVHDSNVLLWTKQKTNSRRSTLFFVGIWMTVLIMLTPRNPGLLLAIFWWTVPIKIIW